MKKIITYFGLLTTILLLFYSCIDDKGNYNYTSSNNILPVRIEGLCKDTTIIKGDILKLSPIIVNDDPARYTYSWYIMDYDAQGFLPRKWDLSEKKDLEWTINLDVAKYRLNFRIYDKERDVFTRHEIIVNIVATPINTGWYILKDEKNETDIDYISLNQERYENILTEYGGGKIPGTAIMMAYQNSYYDHVITNEDGSSIHKSGLSAYHILSSEDIRTYDAKDFTLYKTYEEEFYAAPTTCLPQYISCKSFSDVYLINNGKIHDIKIMYQNIGKFGAAYVGVYDLANAILPYGSGNMVFDKTTHTINELKSNNTLFPIEKAGNVKDTLLLKDLDYVCSGSNFKAQNGTLIMKKLTDNNYYLLQAASVYDPQNYTYINTWPTIAQIDETSRLRNASIIATSKATFFYFSVGDNKVYSYVHSDGTPLEYRERERLSFPGETVTNLTYVSYLKTDNDTTTEALAVLTSQNGTWKLRIYALLGESTPDLNTTPLYEYEGIGNARYLLYRES